MGAKGAMYFLCLAYNLILWTIPIPFSDFQKGMGVRWDASLWKEECISYASF